MTDGSNIDEECVGASVPGRGKPSANGLHERIYNQQPNQYRYHHQHHITTVNAHEDVPPEGDTVCALSVGSSVMESLLVLLV